MVVVVVGLGEEGNREERMGEGGFKVAVMLEQEGGDIVVKCVQRDWKILRGCSGY